MAAINRVGNNPSVLFYDFFDPHIFTQSLFDWYCLSPQK